MTDRFSLQERGMMSPIKSRELISPFVKNPKESEELEFLEDYEDFRKNEFTRGK